MSVRRSGGSMLMAIFLLFVMAGLAGAQSHHEMKAHTVNGYIANLDQVKKFASKATCIQLVPISDDGKLTLIVKNGKLTFESPLPKFPLPDKPGFTFKFKSLPLGKYVLVVMPLSARNHMSQAVWQGKRIIVRMPQGGKGWTHISLGKMTFPIKTKLFE